MHDERSGAAEARPGQTQDCADATLREPQPNKRRLGVSSISLLATKFSVTNAKLRPRTRVLSAKTKLGHFTAGCSLTRNSQGAQRHWSSELPTQKLGSPMREVAPRRVAATAGWHAPASGNRRGLFPAKIFVAFLAWRLPNKTVTIGLRDTATATTRWRTASSLFVSSSATAMKAGRISRSRHGVWRRRPPS